MPSQKRKSLTTPTGTISRNIENATQGSSNRKEDDGVTARKVDMLHHRQLDLDCVIDNHDDLVREAFQLDKFVTLLSYDPKVAKLDNSQVFLEYKAPYDLLSKTSPSPAAGDNTRKTRRATIESRESLVASISRSPRTPLTTSSSASSKAKGKAKATVVSRSDPESSSRKTLDARKLPSNDDPGPSSIRSKAKRLSGVMAPPPPLAPSPSKRVHHPRRATGSFVRSHVDNSEPSDFNPNAQSRGPTYASVSSSSSKTPLNRPDVRASRSSKRSSTTVEFESSELSDLPNIQASKKPTIKRIRLFQRPPPAVYTHPLQIPPRPVHHSSAEYFLASFTSLEDGVDVTHDDLCRTASTEAKTRARIRELRQQGRLLLDIPELPDGSIGFSFTRPDKGETNEIKRGEDHYSHLVSAAARRGLLVSAESTAKRTLAKKVAKIVMAWHANKGNTEEKQRKVEAVRLRTLAKFTIKEVEKQWKKAVLAVREHNRAILDAEEARLGRKHLDAILNQSGAILEAQHTDLRRARSRSSSAMDWSGSAESDGDSENLEGDTSSEHPEDSDDEIEGDVDVSMLLGDNILNSLGSRDPSSDADINPMPSEIDDAPSRGSSRAESPTWPHSEESSSILRVNEENASVFSRSPSEAVMFDRVLEDTEKDVLTSVDDAATTFSIEADQSQQEDDASEEPLNVLAGATTPYAEEDGQSVDDLEGLIPSPQSSPMATPSSPHDLDTPIIPPSPSPRNSRSSPPPRSQKLPSLDVPTISTDTTQIYDLVSLPKMKSESHIYRNERETVPVRLSNGVIIYREVETLSPPSPVTQSQSASNINGHDYPAANDDPSSVVSHQHDTGMSVDTGKEVAPEADSSRPCGGLRESTINQPLAGQASPVINGSLPEQSISSHLGSKDTEKETPVEPASQEESLVPVLDADGVENLEDESQDEPQVAPHLMDFAAVSVDWDSTSKVNAPFLLRGSLRPYQQSGLEWLASLHTNNLNGILADEMGLGKTIQTIALLAHLACDRGIWGPHLIVVPTSVLLNWEMEFKKFLPGFKILSYHGSTKRRKELRVGWNNKHSFNVCVTSYTLASRDAHIFKRKYWYYMVLDEAHMIKNFKSQRWNLLLMFRSFRRLLLTGTPLQNNLTELWALLQFLMSGTNFANLKEFGDWFSNPLEKAIEQGTVLDEETQERVKKLHTVLRPYLLRRLKIDVEKELPSKYEHLVMCRLSKRQRFLYDEFMSRAQTRSALASGMYHQVANILMQLRKVCNHPDLFEVRPIVTSFAMTQSAAMDFEIKELLIRKRFLESQENSLNLDFLGFVFVQHQGKSMMQARSTRALDASSTLPFITELPGEPPPVDTRTIDGFKRYMKHQRQLAGLRQWTQIAYTNGLRCAASPVYGSETISVIRSMISPLAPLSDNALNRPDYLDSSSILPTLVKSYERREQDMAAVIDRFAFVTPPVVARDMPSIVLSGLEHRILCVQGSGSTLDAILHRASVKLQIAFPDASLIQYDCGKLQELASLLHKRKAGGHRVLIFTQMTKVLDILEIFLNFHGYRYLRLDGATKIEDRQYITERFNNDERVFAFIASSRSGGVGINLTGADTVVFYDSDFNPQMDRQCEDRAHRIGQIRDVHIYRFISEHTVEESMLRKANQKRSLDNIVIQQGEFDWRSLLIDDEAFGKALGEFEDQEDAHAARVAAREEAVREVEDNVDFADDATAVDTDGFPPATPAEEEPEDEGTVADYMLAFVKRDWEFFASWR